MVDKLVCESCGLSEQDIRKMWAEQFEAEEITTFEVPLRTAKGSTLCEVCWEKDELLIRVVNRR